MFFWLVPVIQGLSPLSLSWDLGRYPEARWRKDRLTDQAANGGVIPKYFQPQENTQGHPPCQAHKPLTGQFSQDNLLSGLRKDPAGHSPRAFSAVPLSFVTLRA